MNLVIAKPKGLREEGVSGRQLEQKTISTKEYDTLRPWPFGDWVWPFWILFLPEECFEVTTSARPKKRMTSQESVPSSMPCLRIWIMRSKFSVVHLASLILRDVSNKATTYRCLTVPGKGSFSFIMRPTAFATFFSASMPREEVSGTDRTTTFEASFSHWLVCSANHNKPFPLQHLDVNFTQLIFDRAQGVDENIRRTWWMKRICTSLSDLGLGKQ